MTTTDTRLDPRARASLSLRIIPPGLYARRSHVVLERAFRVYRRSWMIIFSGFFEPLFYLFALGTGMHKLVGTVVGPGGHVLTYAEFIAPALLAASAMNGAIFDSTINVFFKLKFAKLYDSMLATSLGPIDVAIGEISWALIRGGLYSLGFVIVMAAMGLIGSWWGVLMLPVALLIALAFASIGMAVTTYMKTWQHLEAVTTAILPMFLFSGTFYGLSVYPHWLRIVVECLPLNHGIVLMRNLNAGVINYAMLGHVLYFVVMAVIGLSIAGRRLEKLLMR